MIVFYMWQSTMQNYASILGYGNPNVAEASTDMSLDDALKYLVMMRILA